MAIRGRYQDEGNVAGSSTVPNGHTDAPPSYEAVPTARESNGRSAHPVDEKLTLQRKTSGARVGSTSAAGSQPLHANPPPRRYTPTSPSPQVSSQVRQTVLTLLRDLVLNAESPDLLDSCADACRTYRLDLSALLQGPFIEGRSAIYWAILKSKEALLPSLLVHATPLSVSTISEIRLACLVIGNQHLFQSLRCSRECLKRGMKKAPLDRSRGPDALVLGAMPTDEVSIRETQDQAAFVAEIRINLWQKRVRISGVVSVDFIARGRIWFLTFSSPPSGTNAGTWLVKLGLLEHSPPTFIDSRLVIDPALSSSSMSVPAANTSQASELISLLPWPDDPNSSTARSSSPPSSPLSHQSESESKVPQTIELRLNSIHRLACRHTNDVEQWTDDNKMYTNRIVVPLGDGASAGLLYDNTPFLATDGTLHARLEVRLEKPDTTGC